MRSSKLLIRSAAALAVLISSQTFALNLVVNGDFSAGKAGFTTGYTLTTMTPYLFQNADWGIYTVEPIGSVAGSSAYGDWVNVTTDPFGSNGNVFVADGSSVADTVVWTQTVAVTPNTDYTFSFYGAEISNACCSNAVLVPTINGTIGAALNANASWQQNPPFNWNSGASTTATLALVDSNTSGPYNDFVLTGLSLAPASGTPFYAGGQLTLPSLTVGGASFTNCVVSIAGLVSGPTGSAPNGTVASYNVANNQVTVPAVTVGSTTYYNAVATVGDLISVSSVTGADSYDISTGLLTISSVIYSNTLFTNVVVQDVSITDVVLPIAGGMPKAENDEYANGLLTIPAVQVDGAVFTNVTVRISPSQVVSISGIPVSL